MERKLDGIFRSMCTMFMLILIMHMLSRVADRQDQRHIQDRLIRIESRLNVTGVTVDALAHDYLADVKRARAKEDRGRVPDGPRSYAEMKPRIIDSRVIKNIP